MMTKTEFSPTFIIGTGRCGSTMLHDIICYHRDVCWLTPLADRYPWRPRLNATALRNGKKLLPKALLHRLLRPVEPYRFFEASYHGFSTPYRDLFDTDVRPGEAKRFRDRLQNAAVPRQKFIAKYTGWSRIGLLREIFSNAKFIHIVRDGRAVVNSVLKAGYFDGWSGPENWNRGQLSDRQTEAWRDSKESFVILAAIGWENRVQSFLDASQELSPNDYLQIRYEDFCADPAGNSKIIFDFMNLETHDEGFERALSKKTFRSANDGWNKDLDDRQQKELTEFVQQMNAKLGYRDSN